MQSVILQQMELHFGEEFETIYANTRSYVKSLIGRRSWWADSRAMLASEGPLSRMVEDCLSHVIEKNDKVKGWQSYTKYLSSLYGSTNKNTLALEDKISGDHDEKIAWSTMGAYNNPHAHSFGETLVIEEHVNDFTVLEEDEVRFLEIYYSMGVKEAAAMWSISAKEARYQRNRIKSRVKTRMGS